MTVTARQVIDTARSRHWALADVAVGDGAALTFLNYRARVQLAEHGATIEGLVGSAMSYTMGTQAGLLVALVGGVPTFATTYQNGWPVHIDGSGVPYIDTSEAPIAVDPFGAHGGTPGIPLPADFVRLIAVALLYGQGNLWIPCDIVREEQRFSTLPSRNPAAFVSGNRLVPLLPTNDVPTSDRWNSVSQVVISYVAVQTLTTLDDVLNYPALLTEMLIADTVLFLALQSEKMPAADKAGFRQEAAERRVIVKAAGLDLLNTPQQDSVIYRGD